MRLPEDLRSRTGDLHRQRFKSVTRVGASRYGVPSDQKLVTMRLLRFQSTRLREV